MKKKKKVSASVWISHDRFDNSKAQFIFFFRMHLKDNNINKKSVEKKSYEVEHTIVYLTWKPVFFLFLGLTR